MTDKEIVNKIRDIRTQNNVHWMKLLEIALETSPAETKAVLQAIRDNDLAISDLTGMLAK